MCVHSESIELHTTDILDKDAIERALEFGNLDALQQIEDTSKIVIVTVTMSWCPQCNAVYGQITSAA
jgi:hypothetical protein